MRLHSLHLKNFRGVRDRRVDFPQSGVVIVQGPNEVGKSSMMEGLDLLLNEKDTAKKAGIRAVQPVGDDVGPAVTAEISSGSYRFTYSKQWLRAPATRLQIAQPKPESLTGAEAHDRVTEILGATVDLELFSALRILQGGPIDEQAKLRGNSALRTALEAASGTSMSGEAEADYLVQTIEQEFLKYFTAKGRAPTGAYREAEAILARARERVSEAQAGVAQADEQIARHERLTNELRELAAQVEPAEQDVTAKHKISDALKEHETAVVSARVAVDSSAVDLASSQEALAARNRMQQEHRKRLEEVEETTRAREKTSAQQKRIEQELQEHSEELRQASDSRDEAAQLVTSLEKRVNSLARAADLKRDTQRLESARRAAREKERAERALERYRVDDEIFERIQGADQQVQIARTLLNDSAAQIAVSVSSAEEIFVDGDAVSISPDAELQLPASRRRDLEIGSNVRITVTPARGGEDRQQTLHLAKTDLEALLREINMADLAAAREANIQYRKNFAEKTAAENTLAGLLGNDTLASLEERVSLLEQQVLAAATSAGPAADNEAELKDELDTARSDLAAAEQSLTVARARNADLENSLSEARIAVARAESEFDSALVEHKRVEEELTEAEAKNSSIILKAEFERAEATHAAALRQLREREQELAKHDPELVQAQLENAQKVLERLRVEHAELRDEITRSQGQLELMGTEGRQDLLDAALTALEAAQQEHETIARRARAARLLYETVERHQREMWQRYVSPFQERITALGRFVFGPEVRFDVTSHLEIEARTMGQETVPFDALSTGAKEQIGILSRLACAQLVAQTGGVPVLIDDALGNTDPSRLSGLGTVLAQAGKTVQVIVLTCTPERYRDVGDAHVVRL